MKKLRLDLDDLQVESFDTMPTDAQESEGTVFGNMPPTPIACPPTKFQQDTCVNTCAGSTCNGTCNYTCAYTCGNTCANSCDATCHNWCTHRPCTHHTCDNNC